MTRFIADWSLKVLLLFFIAVRMLTPTPSGVVDDSRKPNSPIDRTS
jgi:hypothetical protein